MKNKNRYIYKFDDFTIEEYTKLIKLGKSKYEFIGYDQINFNNNFKFVLWRHDVDFSIENAYKLSEIESELEVKATYFLYLHSEFYNCLDYTSRDIIKKISLHHDLALHFDFDYYQIKNESELEYYLNFEKDIIESVFEVKIKSFSFHNPSEEALKYRQESYAGLVNTYSEKMTTIGYCSDSNGYWRFDSIKEKLEISKDSLQILTHPIWWRDEVMSPLEKIKMSISDRVRIIEADYNKMLSDAGRENIDW